MWEGIIVSSLAGEKGGLGALPLVKQAKTLYEQAIQINGNALDGSAYNSLGVLYYKVPGWPGRLRRQGQGARAAAEGTDAESQGHRSQLLLCRIHGGDQARGPGGRLPGEGAAGTAAARPQLADQGRREEVRVLMEKVTAK